VASRKSIVPVRTERWRLRLGCLVWPIRLACRRSSPECHVNRWPDDHAAIPLVRLVLRSSVLAGWRSIPSSERSSLRGSRPLLGDQATMPAQDRGRRDQAMPPQQRRQSADQRGEHRSICPVQARSQVGLCAARQLRDVTPIIRRTWMPTNGEATTADSAAAERPSRPDATTRPTITPCPPGTPITQASGTDPLLEPHRVDGAMSQQVTHRNRA
jgi:hypothetical protein